MKIVGLVGPKGAGKDTVFELLRDMKKSHGKISFAGPLKQICKAVFDLNDLQVNDAFEKERLFKVPMTLFTASFNGFSTDLITLICAAQWIVASMFLYFLIFLSMLKISPTMNFAFLLIFFLFPVDKLSRISTL